MHETVEDLLELLQAQEDRTDEEDGITFYHRGWYQCDKQCVDK
jgi:hypothetical protein